MDFVIHVCKNPECNNCWIDKDRYNAQNKPPQWKYCSECEKKGFKNPRKRRNKKDEKIQP